MQHNLVILVQATTSKYYMCKVWKLSNELSIFCITFISKVLVFLNFVYNPMGASPTGASPTGSTPTTIYILIHNFIISYRAGFNLSLLKRAINYLWYDTKYTLICEIFLVWNFEKSCNSSTLLMELFKICGLQHCQASWGTHEIVKWWDIGTTGSIQNVTFSTFFATWPWIAITTRGWS